MKKASFTFLLAIIMFTVFCSSGFATAVIGQTDTSVSAASNVTTNTGQSNIRFSYLDILEEYYSDYCSNLYNYSVQPELTFDEFCEGFYGQTMDIMDIHDYTVYNVQSAFAANQITDYDQLLVNTPMALSDYKFIIGDVIHEEAGFPIPGYNFGHTAIVSEKKLNNSYYVIEAEGPSTGVVKRTYYEARFLEKRGHVLELEGVSSMARLNAVNFADGQLNKGYDYLLGQLHHRPTSEDTPAWICSTLVWAAYMNAGYNLDPDMTGNVLLGVLPQDIFYSNEIQDISTLLLNYQPIKIAPVSASVWFETATWQIKLTNTNDYPVRFIYNTTFSSSENDAREFRNLGDLPEYDGNTPESTYTIPAGGSKTVTIVCRWSDWVTVCGLIPTGYDNHDIGLVSYVKGFNTGWFGMGPYTCGTTKSAMNINTNTINLENV